MKHLAPLLSITTLFLFTACGMGFDLQPPSDGVQIKISNKLTSAQESAVIEALQALAPGINGYHSTSVNGRTTLNLAPIQDVPAFISAITLGPVTSIDHNVIQLEVDTDSL